MSDNDSDQAAPERTYTVPLDHIMCLVDARTAMHAPLAPGSSETPFSRAMAVVSHLMKRRVRGGKDTVGVILWGTREKTGQHHENVYQLAPLEVPYAVRRPSRRPRAPLTPRGPCRRASARRSPRSK